MEDEILRFVSDQFRAAVGRRTLTASTPLFSTGIIDSFGVLELIAFLEDRFGVTIDPARHEIGEFDSAAKIAALIGTLPKRR